MRKQLLILLASVLVLLFVLKAGGMLPAIHIKMKDAVTETEEPMPLINNAQINTTPILQMPELPTGCESVALTMALNSYGFDLDKTAIASDWMIHNDENYVLGYAGDPFSDNGAGIFPPGLCDTANNFLKSKGYPHKAYDVTGMEIEDLLEYIADGIPVVVWTTIDYTDPRYSGSEITYNERTYRWYSNEHCVMLGGFDQGDSSVTVYDPMLGKTTVDMEVFRDNYNKIGKYALIIV